MEEALEAPADTVTVAMGDLADDGDAFEGRGDAEDVIAEGTAGDAVAIAALLLRLFD